MSWYPGNSSFSLTVGIPWMGTQHASWGTWQLVGGRAHGAGLNDYCRCWHRAWRPVSGFLLTLSLPVCHEYKQRLNSFLDFPPRKAGFVFQGGTVCSVDMQQWPSDCPSFQRLGPETFLCLDWRTISEQPWILPCLPSYPSFVSFLFFFSDSSAYLESKRERGQSIFSSL